MSFPRLRILLAVSLAAALPLGAPADGEAAQDETAKKETTHPIVHPHRAEGDRAAEVDEDTLRRLEALGYAEWTDVALSGAKEDGVLVYDEARAYDGVNLYKSRPRFEAHLMDMHGKILHTWRASDPKAPSWDFVEMMEDGHLLASAKYDYLEKLDPESRVVWKVPVAPHHDLDVDDDGRVYVLAEVRREHEPAGKPTLIRDNDIVILSPDGKEERRIELWDLFGKHVPKKRLRRIRNSRTQGFHGDVFHVNSIELLDRDVPGLGRRGNALLSIRELNTVAVLDLDEPRVVWLWGNGKLDRQHHPSLLDSGRILLFDNGTHRRWSRVLEMDPITRSFTWEVRGDPKSSFFSGTRGSADRLPNGNTLVVDSAKGRVFEITPSGELVWDFVNPDTIENDGKTLRANIYRMPRLDVSILDKVRSGTRADGDEAPAPTEPPGADQQ